MKKKLTALLLVGLLSGSMLAGCGGTASDDSSSSAPASASAETEADQVELVVFAAASMTETLTELSNAYMEENPNVNVVLNFDSSGTLKTQIQEGADCDVFISAGQLQMDQLDANADPSVNTEGLDFVLTAMFVVIFLEQLLKERKHYTAIIGLAASLGCLIFFGADGFLIPSMCVILLLLVGLRKPLEKAGGWS